MSWCEGGKQHHSEKYSPPGILRCGGGVGGERVYSLQSNLKSLKVKERKCFPCGSQHYDSVFPFSYVWCPSLATWAVQDSIMSH